MIFEFLGMMAGIHLQKSYETHRNNSINRQEQQFLATGGYNRDLQYKLCGEWCYGINSMNKTKADFDKAWEETFGEKPSFDYNLLSGDRRYLNCQKLVKGMLEKRGYRWFDPGEAARTSSQYRKVVERRRGLRW